jgi:hypothetical protein
MLRQSGQIGGIRGVVQVRFGESVWSCKLGVLALFVKEMEIWGEMEGLDRALYIYSAIFHSCKWNIVRIFFLLWWIETKGSIIAAVICGGYGGIELDDDCDKG